MLCYVMYLLHHNSTVDYIKDSNSNKNKLNKYRSINVSLSVLIAS